MGVLKGIAITSIFVALASTNATAEYLATGPIEGNVCWGIGIEICSMKKLDAVKGKDGRLYTISDRFEAVTEYKQDKERCWIRTKSVQAGLISWGINVLTQPEFYEKEPSGEYKKHDVEYVTFKCVKR